MKALKIAASDGTSECFLNAREVVPLSQTDFTDVAVAVVSVNDVLAGALDTIPVSYTHLTLPTNREV